MIMKVKWIEYKDWRDYFKKMWYSDEVIENHYKYKRYQNDKNKEIYKKIEEEHKEEIEKVKKYFKKVKVSLKWDWIWCNINLTDRVFIYFYDIDDSIKFYNQ